MSQISVVHSEFLKMIKAFLHCEGYTLPSAFSQFEELFQLAAEQKLSPVIYDVICHDPCVLNHPEIGQVQKRTVMREVMLQMQREEGFLRVYDTLNSHGIRPLVLKGIICRHLYPKPDYRVSADEDILIRRSDFSLCDEVLRSMGFVRSETDADAQLQEVSYVHPKSGVYLEVHMSLFAEDHHAYGLWNREFEDVFENCVPLNIQNHEIWTLDATSLLFYLLSHLMKHFYHSGVGIRQLCDLSIMADHFGKGVDWKVFTEKMEKHHMRYFFEGLMRIAQRYLGFHFPEQYVWIGTQGPEENDDLLLQDILQSGIYGNSTEERRHSANVTLAAVGSGKKNTTGGIAASLFPSADYIKQNFPWAKMHPVLLPFAYIARIVRYLLRSIRRKTSISSLQIGAQRVELLRKYRIID